MPILQSVKVKFSAIWEKENNRILFYGPTGNRYQQIDLEPNAFALIEVNK